MRGLLGPWDAPYARREHYATEDDPSPPEFVEPPHWVLPADADPDALWGVRQAYAAQVALLDGLIGTLWDLAAAGDNEPPLLCFTSCRGYPLGVHGRLGFPDAHSADLYGETTHLPWILRFPGGEHAGGRAPALVEPGDLPATLVEACQLPAETPSTWQASLMPMVRGDAAETRDRQLSTAEGCGAIRTAAWHLIRRAGDGAATEAVELYSKPDDRWEVNEVSARCPQIAETLRQLLGELERRARGGAVEMSPLYEMLRAGFT